MARVMAERCSQCLFTPERIVPGPRMRQIIATCREQGTHFSCHLGTIAGGQDVWCRGWWESQEDPEIRALAEAMGVVEFVTPEQVADAPAYMRRDEED